MKFSCSGLGYVHTHLSSLIQFSHSAIIFCQIRFPVPTRSNWVFPARHWWQNALTSLWLMLHTAASYWKSAHCIWLCHCLFEMAPSSPSLFLSWKFPEPGGRKEAVSRGRWQSKMHASLYSSRHHTLEIIKKIRDWQLYYIYCTVYKLTAELRLFPVSFGGWTSVFAGCSIQKSTILLCASNFGFLQTSYLSTYSQPFKNVLFYLLQQFSFLLQRTHYLMFIWLRNPIVSAVKWLLWQPGQRVM